MSRGWSPSVTCRPAGVRWPQRGRSGVGGQGCSEQSCPACAKMFEKIQAREGLELLVHGSLEFRPVVHGGFLFRGAQRNLPGKVRGSGI